MDAVLGANPNKGYYKVPFSKGKRAESQMIYADRLGQGETIGCKGQPNAAKLWTEMSRLDDVSTSVAYRRVRTR